MKKITKLISVLTLIALTTSCGPLNDSDGIQSAQIAQVAGFVLKDPAALEQAVYEEINRIRATYVDPTKTRVQEQKIPLVWNPNLQGVAFKHSEDIVARQFLSVSRCETITYKTKTFQSCYPHLNPDLKTPWHRVDDANIPNTGVGENILGLPLSQINTSTMTYKNIAEKMVELWMNSPGHRAIILDDNSTAQTTYLKETGVGIVVDQNNYKMIIATQLFIRKK